MTQAAPRARAEIIGMPAAQTCPSRGLLASGAAARGNPNGNLGTAGPLSRWDRRFESAFLQRRVGCEPASAQLHRSRFPMRTASRLIQTVGKTPPAGSCELSDD